MFKCKKGHQTPTSLDNINRNKNWCRICTSEQLHVLNVENKELTFVKKFDDGSILAKCAKGHAIKIKPGKQITDRCSECLSFKKKRRRAQNAKFRLHRRKVEARRFSTGTLEMADISEESKEIDEKIPSISEADIILHVDQSCMRKYDIRVFKSDIPTIVIGKLSTCIWILSALMPIMGLSTMLAQFWSLLDIYDVEVTQNNPEDNVIDLYEFRQYILLFNQLLATILIITHILWIHSRFIRTSNVYIRTIMQYMGLGGVALLQGNAGTEFAFIFHILDAKCTECPIGTQIVLMVLTMLFNMVSLVIYWYVRKCSKWSYFEAMECKTPT
jgi:hypothetical protein